MKLICQTPVLYTHGDGIYCRCWFFGVLFIL